MSVTTNFTTAKYKCIPKDYVFYIFLEQNVKKTVTLHRNTTSNIFNYEKK